MKMIDSCLIAAAMLALATGAAATGAARRSVSLAGDPLVMRLDKDEFRIAFGINGAQCLPGGCSGLIRYRVQWRATDGTARSELKQVSYTVSPEAGRTIAVDRQYLDTAEGAHTVDVVNVSVDTITCR